MLMNDGKLLFFKRNQSSAQNMQSSFVFEMIKKQNSLAYIPLIGQKFGESNSNIMRKSGEGIF